MNSYENNRLVRYFFHKNYHEYCLTQRPQESRNLGHINSIWFFVAIVPGRNFSPNGVSHMQDTRNTEVMKIKKTILTSAMLMAFINFKLK